MKAKIHKYKKYLIMFFVSVVAIIFFAVCGCYLIIRPSSKYILNPAGVDAIKQRHVETGMVFGAGITKQGKPFKELQARLDIAGNALQRGEVQHLLLTGDNRTKQYDEPTAMRNYLRDHFGISNDKMTLDYAGRSTYESCERADKVFKVNQAIIISAPSHLPRAIYLCRHFGIESYGLSSGLDANNGFRREALARVKAVLNVYTFAPHTILGSNKQKEN